MRYKAYIRCGQKGTQIMNFATLKEAADYMADECEECGTVWDTEKMRWVTGAELLLAAVAPARTHWKETGF